MPDSQVKAGKERAAVVECARHVVQLQHFVAAAPAVQIERQAPGFGHLLDLVHLVQHPLPAAGLADVALVDDQRGPQLEAGNGRLDAGDLFLLRGVELLLAQPADGALVGVGGVVALVERQAAVLQLGDVGRHFVE